MAETSLGFIFEFLDLVIGFFTSISDSLFTDLWTYLENGSSDFSEWLLEFMGYVGLEDFLSNFSLAGFLFSTALVVILVIYFFIP